MGLFRLVVAVLETVLVGAAANGPIASEAEYFAVRNQPAILAAALAYGGLAARLSVQGYLRPPVGSAPWATPRTSWSPTRSARSPTCDTGSSRRTRSRSPKSKCHHSVGVP